MSNKFWRSSKFVFLKIQFFWKKFWFHMHRCLHQRRHKHSPDQNVGFVLGSKEVVHLLQDSPFLDILDDFLQVPWVGDLHIAISSFGISKKLTSLLRRQLPAAGWAGGSSLRTLFLVCVCVKFEHRFVACWKYIVGPSLVDFAHCLQLRAETPYWSTLWFTQAAWVS